MQYIDLSEIVHVVLNRGKTYKNYVDIFPGPKFVSPERRCPLNRGVPKERLYCMWFSLHFDGLSLATCLFPNSFTLIPLIYVKPCFTGDVFIKHMYKGKGKNACLHDHENIDASITLSPSTRIKFCLHLCLCFCIKSVSYYTTLSLC